MSGLRWDVEAFPHPQARESLIGGGELQLVRVRLFDGPAVLDDRGLPTTKPDAFTDLRPAEARHLALELLAAAAHAELITEAGTSR
jgi:hypothetical protein